MGSEFAEWFANLVILRELYTNLNTSYFIRKQGLELNKVVRDVPSLTQISEVEFANSN